MLKQIAYWISITTISLASLIATIPILVIFLYYFGETNIQQSIREVIVANGIEELSVTANLLIPGLFIIALCAFTIFLTISIIKKYIKGTPIIGISDVESRKLSYVFISSDIILWSIKMFLLFSISILLILLIISLFTQIDFNQSYNNKLSGDTILQITLISFIPLLLIAVISLNFLSQIIRNFFENNYFTTHNLALAKYFSFSILIFTLVQLFLNFLFKNLEIYNVSDVITFTFKDYTINVIFLIISAILLGFIKRGISLQKDADSII